MPVESNADASRDEAFSASFANLVLQQTNLALMFLGQSPQPEGGQKSPDLEAAQVFISQLEMLEAKTRGNLTPQEQALLKQSLTTVRLAFVEAVNQAETPPQPAPAGPAAAPAQSAAAAASAADAPAPASEEAESKRKFFKKY